MGIKSAFWYKNPAELKRHLRFIISNPDRDNKALVVNMTSCDNNVRDDESCVLEVGDHPCVCNRSYIKYSKSKMLDLSKLNTELQKNPGDIVEPISDRILKRIQKGAKKSKMLPDKFFKFFDLF